MSGATSSMALFFSFLLIVLMVLVISRRLVVRRQRELLQSTLVHPEGMEGSTGRAITGWSSPRIAPSLTSPEDSDGRTGPSAGSRPREERDQQRQQDGPQRLSRLQQLQIIEMQQMVNEERALQQAVEASIHHRSGETAPEQNTAGGSKEDPALQRALEVSPTSLWAAMVHGCTMHASPASSLPPRVRSQPSPNH